VTGVVCLDVFDEFLLPIFIEEDSNGLQVQQDGAVPNFHIAVRAGLGPQSWPYHFTAFLRRPYTSGFLLVAVHTGYCLRSTIVRYFAGTC
jgi:hypothetical protein